MQRASFSVRIKTGRSFDANHLAITSRQVYGDGDGETGRVSMLSFVSSGEQFSFPADDVVSVDFAKSGVQHCGECDASLWDTIGVGIHDNPSPMVSE